MRGGMAGSNGEGRTSGDGKAPSPAVDRALTVLETLVAAEEPMTLTMLAQVTDIPLATCAAITRTLELRGYAARRVIGRSHFWRPTLRLNGLAAQLVKKVDLMRTARPFLKRLVDSIGAHAHLGVLEGGEVIYVAKVAAPGMLQYDTYPGKASPFNLTALGRAIAAQLPVDAVDALVKNAAVGRGPKAHPIQVAELHAELAAVRERGYATEDEEEDPGIACVAAPFFDVDGAVAGSIGVTGYAEQLRSTGFEEIGAQVVAEAKALGRELQAGTVQLPYGM
ncbi:IclR family transcriptional regulator [Actinocatenispora comari]|nr:IclR family transcriptional regulator [Actinocatenispora comari]